MLKALKRRPVILALTVPLVVAVGIFAILVATNGDHQEPFRGFVRGATTVPPTVGPGRIIGAVTYPNAFGSSTLSFVNSSGEVNFCELTYKDRTIRFGEIIRGSIFYSDGDIVERPLTCGAARTVVGFRALTGRAPAGNEGFGGPSTAPNAKLLAAEMTRCIDKGPPSECGTTTELWIGGVDGSAWHKVASDPGPWRWIDETHLFFSGGQEEPFALDIRTGAKLLLVNPALWDGAWSADGRRVVYRVNDVDSAGKSQDYPFSSTTRVRDLATAGIPVSRPLIFKTPVSSPRMALKLRELSTGRTARRPQSMLLI